MARCAKKRQIARVIGVIKVLFLSREYEVSKKNIPVLTSCASLY